MSSERTIFFTVSGYQAPPFTLLSSAWIGLDFANRLVEPIRRLIAAANVVSTGNLYVQVPIGKSQGDMAQLGATFNKMTQELRTQRDDLMLAVKQCVERSCNARGQVVVEKQLQAASF